MSKVKEGQATASRQLPAAFLKKKFFNLILSISF